MVKEADQQYADLLPVLYKLPLKRNGYDKVGLPNNFLLTHIEKTLNFK